MRIRQIIAEASYDSAITAMSNKFPEWSEDIKWAKVYLKRQDRVIWYLNILKKLIGNSNNSRAILSTGSLESFQEDLNHFIGQGIPKIEAYRFTNQPPQVVFAELESIERDYHASQNVNKPVEVKPGDKPLIEFPDGSAWWFVDRAYCSDEGRSGQHCGNVNGKYDAEQRILSYRINGRVQMTFILLKDGKLGEMKAKANQKPQSKYHPHIMALLLNPLVKGISGEGFAPEMNFSAFDLSDNLIAQLHQTKPAIILDQINTSPVEFLQAPKFIRANSMYRNAAISRLSDIEVIVDQSGNIPDDSASWEMVISRSKTALIHAPTNLDNYRERLLDLVSDNNWMMEMVTKQFKFDFDFVKQIIENSMGWGINVVEPNTPRYRELCIIAVQLSGEALMYVDDDFRDVEICALAVEQDEEAWEHVPDNIKSLMNVNESRELSHILRLFRY